MKNTLKLTVLCLLVQTMQPAFAGTLEDAKIAYDNKQFGECLTKCQQVLRTDSKNEKAHYYQALAYQGSGQMAPAKSEYLWVYKNAKDYNLQKNAWVAIQGLRKYVSHRSVEGHNNAAPPAVGSSSSGTVGSTAQATPPPRKERRITEVEAITIQEEKEREAAEAAGITCGVRRSCGRRCH